jgi:hypothetical protein
MLHYELRRAIYACIRGDLDEKIIRRRTKINAFGHA